MTSTRTNQSEQFVQLPSNSDLTSTFSINIRSQSLIHIKPIACHKEDGNAITLALCSLWRYTMPSGNIHETWIRKLSYNPANLQKDVGAKTRIFLIQKRTGSQRKGTIGYRYCDCYYLPCGDVLSQPTVPYLLIKRTAAIAAPAQPSISPLS